MSIAVSALVRPSRLLALLSLMMGVVLLSAAALIERAADEPLHHALAFVCAIACAGLLLFPLRVRKAFRIDVTGIGQIRLVDTSLVAEAGLTISSSGDGEVVHAMAAQVERVEVAGGVFGGGDPGGAGWSGGGGWILAWLGFIMAGGGDEVAVTGMDVEVIETWVTGERIGQFPPHAVAHVAEDFID